MVMNTRSYIPLSDIALPEAPEASTGKPLVRISAYYLATDGNVPESIDITWQAIPAVSTPTLIAMVDALADVAGRRHDRHLTN
jgi:hypothetical protein